MHERDEWITGIENGYVLLAFVALHEPPRPAPPQRLAQGLRLMAMLRDRSLRSTEQAEQSDLGASRR